MFCVDFLFYVVTSFQLLHDLIMQSQEQARSGPYSCDQCCFVAAFLLFNVAYYKRILGMLSDILVVRECF